MPTWSPKPTRTTSDPASAADANLDQSNMDALKGGVQATPPPRTMVELDADLTTAEAALNALAPVDYVAPVSADQTVVYTDNGKDWDPTVDIIAYITPAGITEGWTREFRNRSATKCITLMVNSSDGFVICKMIPKSFVVLQAKQATPVEATHFRKINMGGEWVDWGGTAGANFGAGFGTVTALNPDQIQARMSPGALKLRGRFQVGTVTTGSGVVLLPFGLSVDAARVEDGNTAFGFYNMVYNNTTSPIWAVDNNSGVFYYRAGAGATYIQIASKFLSGQYENNNVNGIVASGASITFSELTIPVDGWA